jgi:competence protein ComER
VKIGFVGMGNMGRMLVSALIRAHALDPATTIVSNRSREKLAQMAELFPKLTTTGRNDELAQGAQTIFLCIKPGETKLVLEEMRPYITPNHLLVLITNTVTIPALEAETPARVAKVIPSIVQGVGAGVSLLIFGTRSTVEDRALLDRLFQPISHPVVIQESQARICSNLTSCGPAFLAYAYRALALAAQQYQPDLAPGLVDQLIRETVKGTSQLIEQNGLTYADVIDRVSTPGGVTAVGIKVLDEQMAGVWEQVMETTICKEEQKQAKVEL